ncbi:MAG: conjugal transfer protein TrbD [Candidatus Omnitrophota bacterium]
MKDLKRSTPVFQSLTRPILILGGERENIIIIVFIAGAVWFSGKDWIALGIAAVVWVIGVFISRVAAKQDPYQTKVFLKSTRYESFYPARERLITPPRINTTSTTRKYHV